MAVLQWNDLSGRESGSPGDGEVGVGVGALPPHAGSQTPKRCLGVTAPLLGTHCLSHQWG